MKTLNSLDNISIETISKLSDSKVNKIFSEARWGDKPVCVHCGSFKKYNIKNDKKEIIKFKCKDCSKFYSITSNTVFDNRKFPLKKYLLALVLFVNSQKGISSLQLSRDLGISQKASFLMLHKIRSALFNQYENLNRNKLKGTIQMDGAYISHIPKHPNKREDRIDRRTISTIDQQCIITMREIKDDGKAGKSYAFIVRSENSFEINQLVDAYIEKGSTIVTDEHTAYKPLKNMNYKTKTVNHSVEYQSEEGTNTNQAESYFSRLRRMVIGQHHSMSNKYLGLYINEITYRENMREFDNREILIDLLTHCMKCSNTTIFNGYCQRENSNIKNFKDYVA